MRLATRHTGIPDGCGMAPGGRAGHAAALAPAPLATAGPLRTRPDDHARHDPAFTRFSTLAKETADV